MSKRVQLLRHAVAQADLFVGRVGEVTVNTNSNELRVHDGTTAGGHSVARLDLVNVAAASASNAGKMTAAQVTALTAATADILTNAADIATNAADIATNVAAIAALPTKSGTLTDGHALVGNGGGVIISAGFILEQQIPTSTKALFCQAAAPSLWTKDVDVNDKVLRMVSGTGAATGGSWTISGVTVDGHALAKGEIPAHVHTYTLRSINNNSGGGVNQSLSGALTTPNTSDGQADGLGATAATHTHGLTSDAVWRPAYVDVIKCTKDAAVALP